VSEARFATLLQSFFTDRLTRQLRASPHTVAGYRDTFRLLLRYLVEKVDKEPYEFTLDDLDPGSITDFLESLETERGNKVKTRNLRLAAIRSFFRHVGMNEPAYVLHCQRIRAIPQKRHQKKAISSSIAKSWRRWWQPQTCRPGWGAETRRYYSFWRRPDFGSPS
jgi:site-specific recombinase XerC